MTQVAAGVEAAVLELARLNEAEERGDEPAGYEPSAAEVRAAASAAKAELARVLRERVALFADADRTIERLVQDALAKVLGQLAAQPSDYQQWVLPRLVAAIKAIGEELASSASAQVVASQARAWQLGVRSVDAPLQAAEAAAGKVAAAARPATLGLQVGKPAMAAQATAGLGTPDTQQLRAMQQFTTHLIGGAASDTVNTINRELGLVVLGTQTPHDAMRKVQALLPDRSKSQVRGIVATQLAQAFNHASWARLQQQAARDPKLRKMWRRSGKRMPRPTHQMADGQVQEVGKPFVLQAAKGKGTVELMYPCEAGAPLSETMHCGCVMIPWKAGWKMQHSGAKPVTAQELKDRATAQAQQAAKTAARRPAPASTQDKVLAAFGATADRPGQLRDVTGQRLVIDRRVIGTAAQPAALTATSTTKGRDLAAYYAVQTLRRPAEVWQTERVDPATGEIQVLREFVKRFESAGQQWVGLVRFRREGERWVPDQAWRAQPASSLPAGQRPGLKVWPKRKP